MTNSKEQLDIIYNTITDTRFVLDSNKPHSSIKKTLFIWIISLFTMNMLVILFTNISLNTGFWGSDLYFKMMRIGSILGYSLIPILFLISINKISMTLKEKDFLKMFSFIPIFISLSKIIFPISYYLNFEVLIQLYDTIPLDFILSMVGILLIYHYFKKSKYLYIIAISFLYLALFITIKMLAFNNQDILHFSIKLNGFIDFISNYGISVITVWLITIALIKKENYNET